MNYTRPEMEPTLIWVRSTLHLADGVFPGWVGQVDPSFPWVAENLGINLIQLDDETESDDVAA